MALHRRPLFRLAVVACMAPVFIGCAVGTAPTGGTNSGTGNTGANSSTPTADQAAIIAMWQTLKPEDGLSSHDVAPSWSLPYAAGQLNQEYGEQGVKLANFARYVAGLPYDLTWDATLADQAQHGAVLLAAINRVDHTPTKPADMDQAFFDIAYQSTSTSCLFGTATWPSTPAGAVEAFLGDSDPSNIDRVGHRRWILNPAMQTTTFGQALGFVTMQVFDQSRATVPDWQTVLWPCEGNMPVEMFDGEDAWSVSPNPDLYDNTATAGITVALERLADGTSWTLTPADADTSGAYMNVNTDGFGTPFCIIFRPASMAYAAGDQFRVTVSGLTPKSASVTSAVQYETTFFSLGS